MHPIERLRWIARADGEPSSTLAAEAAWTLGELGSEDPAAVLTASRRLVGRHPACGPLWWVCAHLLGADDTLESAQSLAGRLVSDPVPQRVADALRRELTSSDVICATAPVDLLAGSLARRGSYRVRLVGPYRWLRHALGSIAASADEATGYETEDAAEALSGATALLVEPLAAGPSGLLVEPAAAMLLRQASGAGVPAWALLGTGVVLPGVLAEAARDLAGDDVALVGPAQFSLAVDEAGAGDVNRALARTDCPPSPELARRLGR